MHAHPPVMYPTHTYTFTQKIKFFAFALILSHDIDTYDKHKIQILVVKEK